MSTAKQLISAFVDAPPLYWDRSYVQNMREIRGYPNWWRIRDDVAYIDGPPNEGEQYTRDLYVWSVEIVKDEDTGANTNKLELYDLDNTLEESTSVVNGETVYRWKYREQEPELSYEHTDVIDSVSLEFDQLGRRLIAFESAGDVFLIWYDPVPGTVSVTNWGAGYNPQIVTDTYRRTGGSADSERLLFYVDNTTKQIVYRRQNDRYQTAYTLPSAPADVVELLKVSKNLYGGLTVLYCCDDGTGNLKTGSFTARDAEDVAHIGTDNYITSLVSFWKPETSVTSFVLKLAGIEADLKDSINLEIHSQVSKFSIKDKKIELSSKVDSAGFEIISSSVSDFNIEEVAPPEVFVDLEDDAVEYSVVSSNIVSFFIKQTLINISLQEDSSEEFSVSSSSITEFSLG